MAGSLKQALNEPGVVSRSKVSAGNTSTTMVTRSGRSGGLQSIIFRKGPQTGTVSIILAHQRVFVKGDDFGLQYGMGFTAVAAAGEAGRWVEATGGATAPKVEQDFYESAADSLTVSSAVDEIGLDSPPVLVPSLVVVDGELTIPIKMTQTISKGVHVTCLLYLHAANPPLPVEQVNSSNNGATATDVFSSWGQAPVVAAPIGAVPFEPGWIFEATSLS